MKRKLLIAIAMLAPGYLLIQLAGRGWITLADILIVVTIIILIIAILARGAIT